MQFNVLDILAVLVILTSVITAMIKGFMIELISLGSVIAGVFLAVFFYQDASIFLERLGLTSPASEFLGFLMVFLATLILGLVLTKMMNKLLKALKVKWIDRFLGGLFGLVRGWLINVVIFLAMTVFPIGGNLVSDSRLAEFFLTSASLVLVLTPSEFKEKFEEGYRKVYEIWIEETRQEDAAEADESNN
jgi:membrane protein required for colicin V production